ncbi:SCO family protein [Geomonas paludis]|uniref:Cytochrome-c oxidase n=1 Tax=Geomonas paludis TaxID=2740185 RepID=A0A6V8MQW2_9BACT|nr:SCO family protein [Geomonas paludis]UPU36106.1 SCO family protein [Geomonas paludis]GFO62284.1 cytochrome-c oxidase [Geomonas paludis]
MEAMSIIGILRRTVLLGVAVLLLFPAAVRAHSEEDAAAHHEGAAPTDAKVGLEERLGAKIPLDLVFKDENGRQRRLRDLVTGPTIILPVYYSCTNVCNYLQEGLARVLPEIKLEPGKEYRIISVSFDERENPQRALKSKHMYQAVMKGKFPEGNWTFLTGDAANIRSLTDAAGFQFQRKGNDFVHPVVSFVVARDGMIVRYLYGTHFLAKDVTLALMEARQGRVGTTISKMVSYCFSFDPNSKSYEFNILRVSATVIIICVVGFIIFLVVGGKNGRNGNGNNGNNMGNNTNA